jgi:hypothetical protein
MIWDAVSGGVSERVGDAKDAVGASAGGPIIGVRGCSPGCLAFETYTADLHLSHPNGTYDSSLPTHWRGIELRFCLVRELVEATARLRGVDSHLDHGLEALR